MVKPLGEDVFCNVQKSSSLSFNGHVNKIGFYANVLQVAYKLLYNQWVARKKMKVARNSGEVARKMAEVAHKL